MTHAELVAHAASWLFNSQRCCVVTTEVVTTGETPDALGWCNGRYSILVECKISVSDFRADAKKHFRRMPDMGMGDYRYFCTPRGLLNLSSIPEGWGLIESDGHRMFQRMKSKRWTGEKSREIGVMLSVLRRIGQTVPKGIAIRTYVHQTRCTASAGFEADFIEEKKE